MIKDKVDTTYTLTVRPEYAGLIPLVASMNGWTGEGDVKQFLSGLLNEIVKKEIKLMIQGSLDRYYGFSQKSMIAQAMVDYEASAQVASVWSTVEE